MSQTETLTQTPLYQTHVALGAKMVPFAGWMMPLQYTRVLEEHHAVRQHAGLFDISHMGLLAIEGPSDEVEAALNALVPQDLAGLPTTKAVYTQLLNAQGCMLDDIIVYHLPQDGGLPGWPQWLVICNASNTLKVTQWLGAHLPQSIRVQVMNAQYSLIALQGPDFQNVLMGAGLAAEQNLPQRFHIDRVDVGTVPVLMARTGYTGEDGVEMIVPNGQVASLWDALQSAGARPVGLAARDTLRLEAAYPLYGHELDEALTPLEAGLGWSVKLEKSQPFLGQQALQAQKAQGLTQHFTCFELSQKSIPRPSDLLYDNEGNPLGRVTSGSISPTLNRPIGVGYIQGPKPLVPGTLIQVAIRGLKVQATVVKRPFYQR